MIIIGIILCLLSIFIIHKRIGLIIFGNRACGRIIGYDNLIEGIKGIDTYNYKVEYLYNNKKYVAKTLESVQVARGSVPNKNLHLPITVYFKNNKPDVVTILEFKETTILGGILLILGIIIIIFSLIR